MKKNKIILFALTVSLFLSCSFVAKKMYGIKKPDFQTTENQLRFLKKHGISNVDFYYFKDIKSYIASSKEKYLSIPDAFFFNSNGEYVTYKKKTTDCNAKVDDFINDLKSFNSSSSNKSLKINSFLSLLTSNSKINIEKSEITVFLTWAIFAGKTNKEKTFDWIKLINKAKENGVSISYYLVNCDLQENWNLTNEQKKRLLNVLNR